MRIYERAVAVDGADTIAIAIRTKTHVKVSGEEGFAQWLYMRLNRLRVRTAETRIATAANFVAHNSIAGEELAQQSRCGAVHGIGYESEA